MLYFSVRDALNAVALKVPLFDYLSPSKGGICLKILSHILQALLKYTHNICFRAQLSITAIHTQNQERFLT